MSTQPASGPAVIRVQGVTVGYDGRVVLRDVSFEVYAGEVFVILGGSGCGKSTLLKHVIGLLQSMRGSIFVYGEDIVSAEGERRHALLGRIGVTYQHGALFGSMSVLENVRLPLEVHTDLPMDAMNLIARTKLGLVQLAGAADLLPAELSGGMQKRVAIARAMVLDPGILFLDEPSAGLDPVTSAGLDQLILRLKRSLGMTFVVVTHELPSIFTIADRIIMLDRQAQGVIAQGDPRALRDTSGNPRVRQFFNREPEAAAQA